MRQGPAQAAQDFLGLGSEARMNTPAKSGGNWMWQMVPEQLSRENTAMLREMTAMYERI